MKLRRTAKGYYYSTDNRRISKSEYSRRKKISKSLKAYHRKRARKESAILKESRLSPLVKTPEGRKLLIHEEEISRRRFARIAVKRKNQIPEAHRRFAKKLGKRRPVWVYYYDNFTRAPIDARTALRMRYTFLIERMGARLAKLTYDKAGKILLNNVGNKRLLESWKKRGHLTQREAEKLAERFLRLARKNKQMKWRLTQLEILT